MGHERLKVYIRTRSEKEFTLRGTGSVHLRTHTRWRRRFLETNGSVTVEEGDLNVLLIKINGDCNENENTWGMMDLL